MIVKLSTVLSFLLCAGALISVKAQDDDAACALKPVNKKVAKNYSKIMNPSTSDKDRVELLKQSIQIDPECAVCYFDLATIAFQRGNAAKVQEYMSQIAGICPNYHSEVYYGLATVALAEENNDLAIDYLRKYINFKSNDAGRYGNGYEEKRKWAKEELQELEFMKDYYSKKVPFDPKPVTNVSTKLDEYLPMLSPDNEMMFFTRRVKGNSYDKVAGDEVWLEQLTLGQRSSVQEAFDSGKQMGEPFDDPKFTNLGGVTISVDNHEMIVCGCKVEDVGGQSYKNCDLYISKYQEMKNPRTQQMEYRWGPLINMGPAINTPDGWEANPTLSGNGKVLYFAAIRAGMKDIDIFYSKKNSKGVWGVARPLEGINSNGDDKVPFMHADSKTLYFVSGPSPAREMKEGDAYKWNRKGVGGFDIFYARQNDDGSWGKPQLMAYPINSESDEVGIIVSTDGKTAYFSSNRSNSVGGTDIFSFQLYEEARPDKVVLIKGEVKNEQGKGDTLAVVEIAKKGQPIEERDIVKVNNNGSYAAIVNVKPDDEIIVTAKKENSFPEAKLIKPDDVAQTFVKGSDFKTEKLEPGKSFVVKDILFATASYDLQKESFFVLDQFVTFLKEHPKMRIEIQGHTDNEGVASKNQILSENRARVVKEYLLKNGVSEGQLTHVGYGQEKPKVPNTSAANKALNRRTEFKILSM